MSKGIIQDILIESLNNNASQIAIECGLERITYLELNQESNRVYNIILTAGIKKGSIIGVLLDNRINLISVLIGILKAGCVFMPLDPIYPLKRLESMILSTNTKQIFVDNNNLINIHEIGNNYRMENIFITDDIFNKYLESNSKMIFNVTYEPDDMIYIYFTSGTSGNPKAIAGRNKGLWHFINWEIETFNIREEIRISQVTPPCHDPFLRDVFTPLCAGGTICIPKTDLVKLDPNHLGDWIEKTKLNLIHCTPSLFKILNSKELYPDYFSDLKYILLAGEKVVPKELEKWYKVFNNKVQLVNLYGPSETTLAKLYYFIQPSDVRLKNIPIGKPIRGASVIIVNEDLNICPNGEIGEIVIRTPYRSLGYYNNSVLTSMKFKTNPFNNDSEDIVYLTGDIGRVLPDGNIDFIGRKDRQVKIRGFRVELQEIEHELLNHKEICECVVDIVKYENNKNDEIDFTENLVAYYVSPQKINSTELRMYLEQKLPDYSIPNYFIHIQKIPITSNGKIDYESLSKLREVKVIDNYVAPRNEIEQRLKNIWEEILEVKDIGIDNNFLQIGGYSLKILSLISHIYKEFGVELSLEEIFDNLTINKISSLIIQKNAALFSSIKQQEELEYYPVSCAQKRMYLLNQKNDVNTSYNISGALLIEGNLNQENVKKFFDLLIKRHDSLRTSFVIKSGEIVQRIHEDIIFNMIFDKSSEEDIKERISEFIKPFDLTIAPLFRVGLIQLSNNHHLLIYDMHHIISDGISLDILIREFINLYKGEDLPKLKIQYKDFSAWQNKYLESTEIKIQETYWLNRLHGKLPVINLPIDFPRPDIQSFEGNEIRFKIGEHEKEKISEIMQNTETTLFMILLSVFNILLSKYSALEDIIIGTPIAGRQHVDCEGIVGMFVNTLAIRSFPKNNMSFLAFLKEVKRNCLRDFENQNYQFEKLIEKLDINSNRSRNPLFDTMFILQKSNLSKINFNNLSFISFDIEKRVSKFDLKLTAIDIDNEIEFILEYCIKLFRKKTIEEMAKSYLNIVKQVISNPTILLAEIETTIGEKNSLLSDFNENLN